MPWTSTSSFISAAPRGMPMTQQAPDLSPFMVVMDEAGLMSSPPLSKVMPLPTNTTFLRAFPPPGT